MTRLALVGYGKMGRLLEELAPAHGFEVAVRLDSRNRDEESSSAALLSAQVAIDFSVAGAVLPNVLRLADLGIPMVVGTTGWRDDLPRIRAAVENAGIGLVHGANFSLGVMAFSAIVEEAARILARADAYDAFAYEIHHRQKRDAPSGTLLELLATIERAGYDRPVDVASNRAGAVPGTHVIGFDGDADTILLEHRARSRADFARGALRAARWVLGRQGCHEFRDVWREVLSTSTPIPNP